MTSHRWYVLVTGSRAEKVVQETLHQAGIETLLPLVKRTRHWKGRTKVVEWPVFPGYCFVRLPDEETHKALGYAHVIALAGSPRPEPMDHVTMRALYRMVTNSCEYKAEPCQRYCRTVHVIHGPLQGLQGQLRSDADHPHLIIPVPVLQRAISVSISERDVEDIEPSVTTCIAGMWTAARRSLRKIKMTSRQEVVGFDSMEQIASAWHRRIRKIHTLWERSSTIPGVGMLSPV
jgi:transcription termination/antitermination protein NusG